MRKILLVLALAALTGCSVETVTTAATGAALKKKELEQGKKTMARVEQQLDQAMLKAKQAHDRASSE